MAEIYIYINSSVYIYMSIVFKKKKRMRSSICVVIILYSFINLHTIQELRDYFYAPMCWRYPIIENAHIIIFCFFYRYKQVRENSVFH